MFLVNNDNFNEYFEGDQMKNSTSGWNCVVPVGKKTVGELLYG